MNENQIYINEIIRINYKCNWKCKFCNVLMTNNYWLYDISSKEVIYKIFALTKKYTLEQRKKLTLSFSWGEPTLNKNLFSFIRLAKKIWIWVVDIQTNGTTLYKNKDYINNLIDAWLDDILIAQHSWSKSINVKLWCYYDIDDFVDWVNYIKINNINKKILIHLNIVITKINLYYIYDYINFLIELWFIDLLEVCDNWEELKIKEISFAFVQPNWYAKFNQKSLLLEFDDEEVIEIDKIIKLCKNKNISPDFHFTSPPICILNFPKYNLEFQRLNKVDADEKKWNINIWNLESYKYLWKEKRKFKDCDMCKYNKFCLWFYNNWVDFVWEEKINKRIKDFIYKS